jgi:hypothetical protein
LSAERAAAGPARQGVLRLSRVVERREYFVDRVLELGQRKDALPFERATGE